MIQPFTGAFKYNADHDRDHDHDQSRPGSPKRPFQEHNKLSGTKINISLTFRYKASLAQLKCSTLYVNLLYCCTVTATVTFAFDFHLLICTLYFMISHFYFYTSYFIRQLHFILSYLLFCTRYHPPSLSGPIQIFHIISPFTLWLLTSHGESHGAYSAWHLCHSFTSDSHTNPCDTVCIYM